MALSQNQREQIEKLLRKKLDEKLIRYERESTSMPFLARLIKDEKSVAAYSFVTSMATTLGMSIYEEVSCIIAKPNCSECKRNYKVGGKLSTKQKSVISDLINQLRENKRKPSTQKEMKEVLKASKDNAKAQKDGNIADFYMQKGGKEYLFEIKTAKPNIDVFTKSKEKLLQWIARRGKPVKVFLVLPYNPYHPKPYKRFADQNLMDHPNDFLIGEEYWDFIGGKGAMNDILKIFSKIGSEYKEKIDKKIKEVSRTKIKL